MGDLVRRLGGVDERLRGYEYLFMSSADYDTLLRTDLPAAMKVYWLEILYRAHYGACVSLLRTIRWLDAVVMSAREENFYGFAASLRGLMEAAGDSHHTIGATVLSLADSHVIIRQALAGSLYRVVVHPILEDALIHFTHARRVGRKEDAPSSHRAKSTAEYLGALEAASGKPIHGCYSKLCEVTHPASASTFLYREQDLHGRYRIGSLNDARLIDTFCRTYSDLMAPIVVLGVTPAVYQLRVVETFNLPTLAGPDLNTLELEGPVWDGIRARLEDPSPPQTRGAEE